MLFVTCIWVWLISASLSLELDKLLPEDVFNVIDDVVTNLMADELHPTKKDEPVVEEVTENQPIDSETDSDDDIPDLEYDVCLNKDSNSVIIV